MAPSRPDELPADERAGQDLDSVLASYLKAIDQGVSRESLRGDFLRRYPQHASTLREFFADGDELERYFGAMQESGPPIASPAKGVELGPSAAIVGAHLGDYEILEEIDRGGMGVVFKARQESLDRIVALKVIAAGWLASATEVERFRREAITAARLDHPGIVPVYEVGESEGHRFIAMKHIEGRGLDRHLARFTGRYRECALIVESLAHALEHAHSSGVLHRDIKPSNILLDGAGNPLLADFGLAKASGETSLTVSCAMAGTLRYLAPELLSSSNDNGAAHSARSDLYSLGCVLYELIVGRAAFPADSTGELLHQILSDDPLRPSLLDRRVPRDLETICLKCLEKSPSRRYSSAGELAQDLRRYLDGRPIVARRTGPIRRLAKSARRNPAGTALIAFVFIGVVLFVVLSIRHQSELRKYIVEKEQESARVRRVYERIVEADKVHTASASRERSSIDFVKEALDRIVPTEGPHAPTFPERLLLRELELMPPALGAEFGQGDNRGTFFFDAESQFWITHRNHRASRWSIHPTPSEIEAFPWPRDAFWGFPHRGEFVWFIRRGDSGFLVARDGRTLTAEVPLPPAHEPHEIILPNHEFVVAIRFGRRISVHSFESGLTIASTELPGASIDRVQFVDHDQELFFLVGESVYSWQWQDEISPRPIATIAEAVSWTASPSGKHLVAQAGRDLVHVDVESGEQTLLAPDATCSAFCFSPDERLVAVGQSPRWLRVYDLSTSCEVFRSLAGDAPINHLAFHESSELIAGGSDLGTVRLWEIGAGCIVASAPGHSAAVRFAQVSDDGTRFLTGADDFVLRGWRVEDDKLGIKVHPAGSVSVADLIHRCGTVSADLETYAMGRDDGFVEVGEILWKGDDLRIAPMDFVRADTARLLAVRFSPSGHLLATGSAVSKILTLWNVRREPGRMKLERRFSVKLRIGAQRVDFSPDGRLLLVSIAHNPTSVIVDCETDSVVAELSSASRVHAAAFSPDSRNLLAGGQTGTFSVFRVESTPAASIHVETLSLRITGDTDLNHGTKAITFIPGTHMFFTGGSGGALEVWELVDHGDNRSIVQFAILKEHQLPITAIGVSADGCTVVTGTKPANERSMAEVKVWRAR